MVRRGFQCSSGGDVGDADSVGWKDLGGGIDRCAVAPKPSPRRGKAIRAVFCLVFLLPFARSSLCAQASNLLATAPALAPTHSFLLTPSFLRALAAMSHLPIPPTVSSTYLTETAAMAEINKLRRLYEGHGLSDKQRAQLNTAVEDGVTKVQNIYWNFKSSDPQVRQEKVDALIVRIGDVIRKVNAERRGGFSYLR